MRRKGEAAVIFGGHGFADATTTAAASSIIGREGEINPLVRWLLLEHGELATAVTMTAVVAVCAVGWAVAAEWANAPTQIGYVVGAVGYAVAAGNVVAIVVALS